MRAFAVWISLVLAVAAESELLLKEVIVADYPRLKSVKTDRAPEPKERADVRSSFILVEDSDGSSLLVLKLQNLTAKPLAIAFGTIYGESNLQVITQEEGILWPPMEATHHEIPNVATLQFAPREVKYVKIDFAESSYLRNMRKSRSHVFAIQHLAFSGNRQAFGIVDAQRSPKSSTNQPNKAQ